MLPHTFEALKAGCDDFIHKPFQQSEIFENMALYLGVKYIYESPSETVMAQPKTLNTIDIEQYFAEYSVDWLSTFLQAAIELDEDAIAFCITEVKDQNLEVAQALTELANTLEFHRLAELAQNALELLSQKGHIDLR